MAMTKKEQAAFEALRQELAEARAFRFTEPMEPDVRAPENWRETAYGWGYNAYNGEVEKVSMSGDSFYWGGWISREESSMGGWSRTGHPTFSTRRLALKALRAVKEREFAKYLAKIDREIDGEHDAES